MKQSLTKKGVLIAAMLGLVLSYQNCGDVSGNDFESQACADCELDPGVIDTKPKIGCVVRDTNYNTIRSITSTSSSQESTRPMNEGETVIIDCSGSRAYDGSDLSSITLTANSAAVSITRESDMRFRAQFNQSGYHSLYILATDFSGHTLSKSVEFRVKCAAGATVPSLAGTSLSISRGSAEGFFNYSLNGSASGGTGPYTYWWDFNGDGAWDLYRNPVGSSSDFIFYSANRSVNNIFNHYYTAKAGDSGPNRRRVQVKVEDSCAKEVVREFDVEFPIERQPLASFPIELGYHYLEAQIRPAGGAIIDRIKNLDLISHSPQSPPDQRIHVKCNYDISVQDALSNTNVNKPLEVMAQHHYGATQFDSLRHSLFVKIADINNAATGIQEARSLSEIQWTTAQAGDARPQYLFQRTGCQARVQMIKRNSVSPCGSGASVPSVDITFLGEFDCPGLTSTSAGSVNVNNAKFFCAVAKVQQCPGGGAAGGANPPPQ